MGKHSQQKSLSASHSQQKCPERRPCSECAPSKAVATESSRCCMYDRGAESWMSLICKDLHSDTKQPLTTILRVQARPRALTAPSSWHTPVLRSTSSSEARPSLQVNLFSVHLHYFNFHNNHKIPIYDTKTSKEKKINRQVHSHKGSKGQLE